MKRVLLIILIFISITFTAGCRKNPNFDPHITKINEIIQSYSLDQFYGFDQSSIQYDQDDDMINEEYVILSINRENELKMMTEVTRKSLLPFDPISQFETSSTTYYFYQNRLGVQINDGAVTWEDSTYDQFNTFKLPIKRLDKSWFINYEIIETDGFIQLKGSIMLNQVNQVLGFSPEQLKDAEITFIYDSSSLLIHQIEIILHFELTHIVITFIPKTEPVQIIIPSGV